MQIRKWMKTMPPTGQFGGAAMEYIIVSLFGTFITMMAIAYLGRVFETKIQSIATQMGVEAPNFDLSLFSPHE